MPNLVVRFTGLCAFVPTKGDGGDKGPMRILVADARTPGITMGCRGTKPLVPHMLQIIISEANSVKTWFPLRRELKVVPASGGDPFNIDTTFTQYVASLEDIKSGNGEVSPDCLRGDSTDSARVAFRMTIDHGAFLVREEDWVRDRTTNRVIVWKAGDRGVSELGREARCKVSYQDSLKIEVSDYTGQRLPAEDRMFKQDVEILVQNVCFSDPDDKYKDEDDSFYWHYRLAAKTPQQCPVPSIGTLKPPPGENNTFCPPARFNATS